jgi:hypothetical protein
MRRLIFALLLSLCSFGWSCGDKRPWMICYRIYEQCDWVINTMTQAQCEAFIAAKPSAEIDAVLDCIRDNFCEKFGPECLKRPTSRHPRW